jgi:hypothetical protein
MATRYRTDGKLFNLRRLQAKTKVKEKRVRDFLFADDCALNASSEEEMQRNMDRLSSACDAFGLTISTKKTEVMFQPAPHTNYSAPSITVKGQKLQAVDKFTYLGSTLLKKAQLRWAGHVVRMSDDRLPKALLYGELADGKRSIGGQRKRFKDSLKSSLQAFDIDTESWECLATKRSSWRSMIWKGAEIHEQDRLRQAESKRLLRKSRAGEASSVTSCDLQCSTCL